MELEFGSLRDNFLSQVSCVAELSKDGGGHGHELELKVYNVCTTICNERTPCIDLSSR